ncbi:MAG: hypothetical protein RR189_03120 [Bacilli bacterium]
MEETNIKQLIDEGVLLGEKLKEKGYKEIAKKVIDKAVDDYSTYNNSLQGLLKLAEMASIQLPFILIEEENKKNIYAFYAGLINSLNKK